MSVNSAKNKNWHPRTMISLLESYIEKKGDGLCMDSATERKKMAKLIYVFLSDVKSCSNDCACVIKPQ